MNYFEFVNKVVIVTGGVNGIGDACANAFARLGARVISFDIVEKEGANPWKIKYIKCDVTNHTEMKKSVESVIDEFGQIDCLVNNSGVHPPATSIEGYSVEQFNSLINLNLTSAYAISQYVYESLKKTKGTIINISSMVGVFGQEYAIAYCASKAGMIGMTKSLAIEAAKHGIRVNCVSPSNVMTSAMEKWINSVAEPQKLRSELESVQVLKRMATPEEVSKPVVFLASAMASFITGINLEVDGGSSLGY